MIFKSTPIMDEFDLRQARQIAESTNCPRVHVRFVAIFAIFDDPGLSADDIGDVETRVVDYA